MGSRVSFRLNVGNYDVSAVVPVANEVEDLLLADIYPASDS